MGWGKRFMRDFPGDDSGIGNAKLTRTRSGGPCAVGLRES
jgi:hypothetical protein